MRRLVSLLALLSTSCVGVGTSRTPEIATQGSWRLEVQGSATGADLSELHGVWIPQARFGLRYGVTEKTELWGSASVEPARTLATAVEVGARHQFLRGDGWNLNAGLALGGAYGAFAGTQTRAVYAHAPFVLGVRLHPKLHIAPSLGVGVQYLEARATAPITALAADTGLGLLVQPWSWLGVWAEGRVLWSSARTEGHTGTRTTQLTMGPIFSF